MSFVPVHSPSPWQGDQQQGGQQQGPSPMARALMTVTEWRQQEQDRKRQEVIQLRVREMMAQHGNTPDTMRRIAGVLAEEGDLDSALRFWNLSTSMLNADTNAARLEASLAPAPAVSPWSAWSLRAAPGGGVMPIRINEQTGEIEIGEVSGATPEDESEWGPWQTDELPGGGMRKYRQNKITGEIEFGEVVGRPERAADPEEGSPEALRLVRRLVDRQEALLRDQDIDPESRAMEMERIRGEYGRLHGSLTQQQRDVYDPLFDFPEPPPLYVDPSPAEPTAPALTGGPGLTEQAVAAQNLAGWNLDPMTGDLQPERAAPPAASPMAQGAFVGPPVSTGPLIGPAPAQPRTAPLFNPDRWIRR